MKWLINLQQYLTHPDVQNVVGKSIPKSNQIIFLSFRDGLNNATVCSLFSSAIELMWSFKAGSTPR